MKVPTINGFPSDFVSPEEKLKSDWHLAWAKKMWGRLNVETAWNGYEQRSEIINNRREAQGNSDVEQFKNQFRDQVTAPDNLPYNIQTPLPSMINGIVGALVNQSLNLDVKAVNEKGGTEYDKEKNRLISILTLSKEAERIKEETGVDISKKIPIKDTYDSIEEIEEKMGTWKEETAIAMEDLLKWIHSYNDKAYIRERVIRDLVENGIAGVRTYVDHNNEVRERAIDIADLVCSWSKDDNYKSIKFAAELLTKTLDEVIIEANLTEEKAYEVAQKAAGKYGNSQWDTTRWGNSYYPEAGNYDNSWRAFKVYVLDGQYISTDNRTKTVVELSNGARRIKKQAKKKKEKTVDTITNRISRVYQSKFIVGTDIVYDYGLKPNQLISRSNGRIDGDATLDFTIYAPNIHDGKNTSILQLMKSHSDMIKVSMLNALGYLATLPPDIVNFDVDSLSRAIVGMGEEGLTERDLVELSMKYGISFSSSTNGKNGFVQQKPVYEIPTGNSNKLAIYLQAAEYHTRMMEIASGIPLSTIGSVEKDALVGIEQLKTLSRNNTLRHIDTAYKNIEERSSNKIILYALDLIKFGNKAKDFAKAIGYTETEILKIPEKYKLKEYGFFIRMLPDATKIETIQQGIAESVRAGTITPDDGIECMILLERSPDKVPARLRVMRKRLSKQKLQEQEQAAQANAQANAQQQIQSTQVAHELRMKELQAETQKEIAIIQAKLNADLQLKQLDTQGKVIVEKTKGDEKIEQIEVASELALKSEGALEKTSFTKESGVSQPSVPRKA